MRRMGMVDTEEEVEQNFVVEVVAGLVVAVVE